MSKKCRGRNTNRHKTNAVRIVEAAGVEYRLMEYDAPDGFLDGVSVAAVLGQDPARTFKTLVTVGSSRENYVCLIPVAKELDLKKAARHFGEKKIEMLPSRSITETTGYIKGGCSPIGMKKQFKTAVDMSAVDFETVMVSGGKVGLQMEIRLQGLLELSCAELVDLTVD